MRESAVMNLKPTGLTQVKRLHFVHVSGKIHTLYIYGKLAGTAREFVLNRMADGYKVVKKYKNEIWYKQQVMV